MNTKRTVLTAAAVFASAALVLTGCAAGDDAETAPSGDATSAAPGGENGGADRPIRIAVFNGWDEGIAASELWKAVLEEQGYEVELEYADPGPVYAGISAGDYDLTLDTWLPITHADYVDEFGDGMVDLGAWNDEASLTIAVNEDAPITSLEELADNADLFPGGLVGIESGSGLVRVTQEDVIPGYGLEDLEFTVSSTPAMLAELDAATAADENVLVTLWRPHWAYDAFPIRDLEDPQGLLGDAENIHTFASSSFEADFPEVHGWLSDFEMSSDLLYSLENVMFNEYDGNDYGQVVADWIAENQEYVDGLTS